MNSIEENNSPEWKWLNTSLNNNLEQERKRRELEEARGDIPSPLWEFMQAYPELTWDDIMGISADVYLDLQRTWENDKRTLGSLHASRPWDDKKVDLYTLEPPNQGNKKDVSRVPSGTYPTQERHSWTLGDVLCLDKVPGRDGICMHAGNTEDETLGCILLGTGQTERAVTNSKEAERLLRDFVNSSKKDAEARGINANFRTRIKDIPPHQGLQGLEGIVPWKE